MPTSTRSTAGRRLVAALLATALAALALVLAPAAQARTTHHPAWPAAGDHRSSGRWAGDSALGTTTVTTAPGVAGALLSSGIVPLPVPPASFGLSLRHGLGVRYGFPIVSSTANLAAGTGDITHTGGINFVSFRHSLEIGRFDIDLAAGKIFATQVDYAAARLPVLDLDLSGVSVSTSGGGTTVSGIVLKLDPVAATALDQTFGAALPTDGSLTFATAVIHLRPSGSARASRS